MSKTFNSRYQVRHSKRNRIEFKKDWHDIYNRTIKSGDITSYDWSNTTDGNEDKEYVSRQISRHPNKKVHRKLIKEFRNMGIGYFGESIYKYDGRDLETYDRRRKKSIKRIMNEKRRFQLKRQADNIINEALNEY